MIQVLSRDYGGGALASAALAGTTPSGWYAQVPRSAAEWKDAARAVAADVDAKWLEKLAPALNASGAAAERLARVVANRGVVVTTGQQPGLFGGPMYTWSKALSALTLADELERTTGIPVAPVFWAATDDADYAEASYTAVAYNGIVQTLRMPAADSGSPMSEVSLGDVSQQLRALTEAAGSAIDIEPLEWLRQSYVPSQTVGGAYVAFLRLALEPLGIAVLDASHPTVRVTAKPVLRKALSEATSIRDSLEKRTKAIEAQGYKVQVQPVPNLSLVFALVDGVRKRIPIKEAAARAGEESADLGPNVLLRPIVERQILPTITYVAGPAELAYFAQVSSVADALQLPVPRVVPRWSGLVLEPHVADILREIGATVEDFRDPHAVEGRVAREEMAPSVQAALERLRAGVESEISSLRDGLDASTTLRKVVDGFQAQVNHRIARLERRYAASVKRSGNARLHDVAVARASLFPNGAPQERALNIVPFLSRYGRVVRDEMIRAARRHSTTLVDRG